MVRLGDTEANAMISRLEQLGYGELQNVFQVAREYSDNPEIRGIAMPAGQRLLWQLTKACEELGH